MKNRIAVALLITVALLSTGCPPLEESARDSLWAAKGFLEESARNHPECRPDLPPDDSLIVRYGPREQNAICQSIDVAAAVYTRTWLLRGSYCGFVADSPPETLCQPTEETTQLFKAELKNAIRDLNRAIGRRRP